MLHEVQYFDNGELACYNGYSFRRDKKTGYYLSTRVIGKRRVRLHRYVWETENGKPIPRGYDIHHIDEDKSNNNIENLLLITKLQHRYLHEATISEETYQKRINNLLKNAVPKAKEWHKSEEGKEWHKMHGRETAKTRKPIEYTCTFCGKKFMSKGRYANGANTFCSNSCKSAYRRASCVDNVEKECKYCGKKFSTNKYSPAKYCPEHRDRKYRV